MIIDMDVAKKMLIGGNAEFRGYLNSDLPGHTGRYAVVDDFEAQQTNHVLDPDGEIEKLSTKINYGQKSNNNP